jgi:hypothetical protein
MYIRNLALVSFLHSFIIRFKSTISQNIISLLLNLFFFSFDGEIMELFLGNLNFTKKWTFWHFLTPWIIQSSSWLDLSHYPYQTFHILAIKYSSSSSSSWKNPCSIQEIKKEKFQCTSSFVRWEKWVWGGVEKEEENIVVVVETFSFRKIKNIFKYEEKKNLENFHFGRFIRCLLIFFFIIIILCTFAHIFYTILWSWRKVYTSHDEENCCLRMR